MNFSFITTFILSLIIFSTGSFVSLFNTSNHNQLVSSQYDQKNQLEEYAKSITVRIFPENSNNDTGGSGVLVHQSNNQYTVVTNYHVVNKKDLVYQVQTFDGKVYNAQKLYVPESDDRGDVAFLKFNSSDHIYLVATIKSDIKIEKETSVIAGGFPFGNDLKQSQTFKVTKGTITEVLERPFLGGYQIGYTNSVVKGMSGGPILNYNQELIGINGMRQYPLFGNPYTFEDGSTITDSQWENFSQLSWAVPVEIIEQIKEKNVF